MLYTRACDLGDGSSCFNARLIRELRKRLGD